MLSFNLEQEANPEDYTDGIERELVEFFVYFQKIVEKGKKLSQLPKMLEMERVFFDNCALRNYGYLFGDPMILWNKKTGEVLLKVKYPEQTLDEFATELSVWKRS